MEASALETMHARMLDGHDLNTPGLPCHFRAIDARCERRYLVDQHPHVKISKLLLALRYTCSALVAVQEDGERCEDGGECCGWQEHPANLPSRHRALHHQAACGCHQVGNGVDANERLKPSRHGLWIHEDVAR